MTGVIAVPSLHPSAIAITVDVLVAEGIKLRPQDGMFMV
jgi:hypothetical protein